MPAEAKAATPQGAAAFARFFMAELNRSHRDPGSQRIAEFSSPSCQTCQRLIKTYEFMAQRKQRLTRDQLRVVDVDVSPLQEGISEVFVKTDDLLTILVNEAGEPMQTSPPASTGLVTIVVSRRAPGWMVMSMVAQQ